jgi:competence protein ComFC
VVIGQSQCGGDHRELRHLTFHVAPFRYAGSGGSMVRRFKLDGEAAAGSLLARAMAAALRAQLGGPWRRALLVPVPLHARRRRERGFDQALWLAQRIGRRLGLAVLPAALLRVRVTLPQGDPRVTSREQNVAGVFAVRRRRALQGRRLILVDDVFTSGATLRACAALLRAAGASEVAAVTACRS